MCILGGMVSLVSGTISRTPAIPYRVFQIIKWFDTFSNSPFPPRSCLIRNQDRLAHRHESAHNSPVLVGLVLALDTGAARELI